MINILKEKIKCRCYVTNTVKYQERECELLKLIDNLEDHHCLDVIR